MTESRRLRLEDGIPEGAEYFDTGYVLPPVPGHVFWAEVFGRQARLVYELGCGSGRFVIAEAVARPECHFVGVEQANEYYRKCHQRSSKRGLKNVRVVRAEASRVICDYTGPETLSECHIYHPDPWPKRRHHQRRLFQPSFCRKLHEALLPEGELYLQTDHKEYFEWICQRLAGLFELEILSGAWSDAPEGRTNYEQKCLRQGKPIWRLVGRKGGA